MGEKRSMVETIVRRKKNWIGHIMRGDGLMKEVVEENMKGKRESGRRRISYRVIYLRRNGVGLWILEEKGRGSARMKSLAARDLPYGRTLKKKRVN